MKAHSADFKEEIKQLGKQQEVQITFGNTTLTSEYFNSVTPSYEGGLLKSVMKQLEIDSNIEIPVGTEINFKYGLLIDGDYEYIDYGKYIVKEVERQEDTRSFLITCYDKILYSMKDYESFNTEYPITIREYITKLCNKLGLTFANANQSFVNYKKEITSELYLDSKGNNIGYTFRDVLDELAQVTASTICINANDQLEIRYIKETNDTINEQYLKDVNVNFGKKYGKINSIVLSRAGGSDNIYLRDENSVQQNGLCELKISDNQIMNFNNRDEFLPEILNKLNGTEYYLNDFTSTGIMYYDLCDRYTVQIGENTYSCVMFNDDCNITQGLEEIIYTKEPETSETDYTKADKTDRKINQTYIIVDKQNQEIDMVVSNVNNITNTKGEAEGKNIHLTDSAEEPFVEVELYGETSQKTRSGKNFFDKTKFKAINNATYTYSNGIYAIKPLGTANVSLDIYINLPAGIYTYSGNGSNGTQVKNSSGTTIANNVSSSNTTFTITEEGTYIRFNWGTGTSTDAFTLDTNNIQIEIGSTATDYEEYGVMPSPDYPSEIENIEGNIEFKVEGKNIWNKSEISEKTSTVNVSVGELNVKDVPIPFTFSSYLISNALTNTNVRVSFMDSNNSNIGAVKFGNTITSTNKRSSITINEIPEGTVKIKFGIRMQDGGHTEKTQLEIGNLSEYQPHQEQTATFPLSEGQKLMEGSYLADDGIHHKRKKYIFTGNEGFTKSNENDNYIRFYSSIFADALRNSGYETIDKFICTHFEQVADYNSSKNCIALNGKRFYITISKTIVTDVTTFKTFLAEQYANGTPVIVEYELAEPETVPYTAEQQEAREKLKALTTYKNVTNITSTAYAKVTYMRDNGLDVYETKQNAEKKYTETTKKLAEQKITVDEISQEVTNVNENLKGNYYTKTETNSKINEKADSITSEVSKTYSTKTETETAKTEAINSANSSTDNKLNDYTETSKLGTFIEQNYEHVKVAWNQISEFIQMMILNSNASLAILDGSKKPLMALDKTGMHFYNFSEQEIGNIGINNAEISFYVNGDVSGSSMSWGICKTVNGEKKYFQVFSYEGYNTEEGTEFGGKFLLEAPLIMQENTLFLGQSINSSYIQGQETDGRKKTTIGNTDDFYIYNSAGNLIFVLNSSYLKLYEQLEMYADPMATGGYDFNFMDNTLLGIDRISASGEISGNNGTFNDIPNSDNVRRFNNTGTDYLIAVLKSSAGGGSIYCQNANSDKKFKKNIKDTEIKALDIIKQIQHRQFDWKENGKHEKIGFIAQELEKINPCLINVIKENDEKTYLLNEKAILATVTKAIQEQQKEIEDLKKEIEKLKENKIEEV